jgi:hypothetical protein
MVTLVAMAGDSSRRRAKMPEASGRFAFEARKEAGASKPKFCCSWTESAGGYLFVAELGSYFLPRCYRTFSASLPGTSRKCCLAES